MTDSSHWWGRRASGWTEGQLKSHTIAYWNFQRPSAREGEDEGARIQWYVSTLLPEELNHAFSRPHLIPPAECDTLVVLVGHSPEPLFQAIGVYEPERLVLVLNQLYGKPGSAGCQTGRQRGEQMKGWIGQSLAPMLDRPPTSICLCPAADQPDEVFRALNNEVLVDQRAGKRVVVDITGAKKSMVAGAFLFAAYAGVEISYVDFDDYEPRARRPYGFSCRIGVLDNPYQRFGLRDWERVRRLYEGTHFRAARESLCDAMAAMRRGGLLFSAEAVTAAKRLRLLLRLYEAWDDGNHRRASRCLTYLNRLPLNGTLHPPRAIGVLGSEWPHAGGSSNSQEGIAQALLRSQDRFEAGMFDDMNVLLAYAGDELAKIGRLIAANEDSRSAFLRAAGLDEFLLKARIIGLWNHDRLWIRFQDDAGESKSRTRSHLPFELEQAVFDALLRHSGVDQMRRMLSREERPGGYPWDLPLRIPGAGAAWAQMDRRYSLKLGAYWKNTPEDPLSETRQALCKALLPQTLRVVRNDLLPDTLQVLRNKSIHMSLYVTRPLAVAAWDLACRNLIEFKQQWTPFGGAMDLGAADDTQPISWAEVCTLLGLDFLPLVPRE